MQAVYCEHHSVSIKCFLDIDEHDSVVCLAVAGFPFRVFCSWDIFSGDFSCITYNVICSEVLHVWSSVIFSWISAGDPYSRTTSFNNLKGYLNSSWIIGTCGAKMPSHECFDLGNAKSVFGKCISKLFELVQVGCMWANGPAQVEEFLCK